MNDPTDERETPPGEANLSPTLLEERPEASGDEDAEPGPAAGADPESTDDDGVVADGGPARPRRGRPPKDAQAPHGPDEVVEAIVAVASEMFASQGYGTVSLRQIAAEAGVNPGLVHRYLGSKEDVLRAVFAKFTYELEEGPNAVTGAPLSPGTERLVFTHQRIIAHLTLEGYDIADFKTDSPIVDLILTAIHEYEDIDDHTARIRALQVLALGLGWRLFESFLLSATGLTEAEHEEISRAIRHTNFAIGRGL
jgi:TetR/AcrR family transcriptional regulator, repressor for neighboring sulfatase